MFGSDYLLGYSQGRSSAEVERDTNALVARVLYGQRPVQVDQSYIDRLRCVADYNYNKGTKYQSDAVYWKGKAEQFHGEALYWKDRALPAEADAKALRAQIVTLHAHVTERNQALNRAQAVVNQQWADHQKTNDEKWGLDLFRVMATWLIEAHIAGRSDWPEFAELRDMAKDVTDGIQRGTPFGGYQDEPHKKARLKKLVAALRRP